MTIRPYILTFVGAAFMAASPSYAVLGLFEKNELREAPGAGELSAQETAAQQLFQRGQDYQKAGRHEKAREQFQALVKAYPLTTFASTAHFEIAQAREAEGDLLKSFDAYQVFIDNHKESDLFGEAIKRQFEIATRAMNAKAGKFLGLRARTQTSRVIEMFTQVAANAPYSHFAPLSFYNVGVLERESSHQREAIAAFQTVLDNYQDSDHATEAHHQIIEIRQEMAKRNDQELDRIILEKEQFISRNQEDPRADQHRADVGALQDREMKKKFDIGRFYEGKGNLKAAAIYYKQVESSYADVFDAAQERLDAIRAIDPNLVIESTQRPTKVQAPVDVVSNPKYLGPPPPKLTEASRPKMRASDPELLPPPAGQ